MSDFCLVSPFGRRTTYLRPSATGCCGFRCTYCMSEDMQPLPRDRVLSLEELYTVADAFISLGVWRIRTTSGEPLVRRDITGLLVHLGQRAELEDLAIATSGLQLRGRAAELRAAGIRHLNVSLDSLQRECFAVFTHSDRLEQVLDGIQATREAGFGRIKLNCAVQKGRNDDGILDLAKYTPVNQLDINLIEEMSLGSIASHRRELTLCTSDEVRAIIECRWPLTPNLACSGGPSRYYRVSDGPSRIDFISPHSNNFCSDCNRVRIIAEGRLMPRLGHEGVLDLRELLRSHPDDCEHLSATLVAALGLKPGRHHFDAQEQIQVLRSMSMTGG